MLEEEVIAGFYRAAHGTVNWSEALNGVSELLNCWVTQLLGVDLPNQRIMYTYEGGWSSAEPVVEYLRHYHAEDPHIRSVLSFPLGEWYHSSDHFDDISIATHPYYQDFLIPYNNKFISGTKVFESESTVIVFAAIRSTSTDAFDSEMRKQMDRLSFHMQQAIALWRRQRQVNQSAAVGRELLDRMAAPVMLIDAERRISVANQSALSLMSKAGPFQPLSGALHVTDREADRRLTLALRRLELGGKPSLVSEPRLERAFVNISTDDSKISVCLIAIRPEATLGAFSQEPVAMVLFHDLMARVELDPFVLSTAYGLSPAEARIAVALTAGKVPKQIASANNVSLATVRTQLKSLYRKMAVSSSGELISLLCNAPFAAIGAKTSEAFARLGISPQDGTLIH